MDDGNLVTVSSTNLFAAIQQQISQSVASLEDRVHTDLENVIKLGISQLENRLENKIEQLKNSLENNIDQIENRFDDRIGKLRRDSIAWRDSLQNVTKDNNRMMWNTAQDRIGRLEDRSVDENYALGGWLDDRIGQQLQKMFNNVSSMVVDRTKQTQNRIENRLSVMQKQFNKYFDTQGSLEDIILSLENMSDDIIEKTGLKLLSMLENAIPKEVIETISKTEAGISRRLDSFSQQLGDGQIQLLKNLSQNIEKTLISTSGLKSSMESNFDKLISHDQMNLLTIKNQTETMKDICMSGETLSHRLLNETFTLNKDLLENFKTFEGNRRNCTAENLD